MDDEKKIKRTGRLFGYANASLQMSYSINGSYMSLFITDICLLSASSLALITSFAGTISIIAMFVGAMIYQYSNTKMGKYRGWVMLCAILIFVGFFLIYNDWNLPETKWAILIAIGYGIVNFCVTMIGSGAYGLMTKVGKTSDQRAEMLYFQNILHCIARVLSAAAILPFVGLFSKQGTGFKVYFIGLSLFAVVVYFFLFRGTKEYDQYDPNFVKESIVKPIDLIKALGSNKELLLLFIGHCAWFILSFVFWFSAAYFYTHVVGSMAMFATFNVLDPFAATVGAALSKIVVDKFDKVKAIFPIFIGVAIVFAIGGILAFMGIIAPVIFLALNVLYDIGDTCVTSYNASLYMDTAEVIYNRTGSDITPVCVTLASVPFKLAFAYSGAIVAAVLAATGYNPDVLTDSARNGILICYSVIPAIGYLVYAFITRFVIKLDRETISRVMKENEERRAKLAAEEAE